MSAAQSYPIVPRNLDTYLPAQQASIVVQTCVRAAEVFTITESNRQALIEWILKEPEKESIKINE